MNDNEKLIEEATQFSKSDLLDFLSKGEAWQAIRGMDAPGLATELDAAGFHRHVTLKPSADTTEPSEEQIDAMQEILYDVNRDGDRDVIRRALRAAGALR